MTTGVQLIELVRGVRAEAGLSLNEAHGQSQRETIVYKLQAKQRLLWEEHDWPLFQVHRDVSFGAQERLVNYPDDLDPQRVNFIERFWANKFKRLEYGICGPQYNAYNHELGQMTTPIRNWDHRYADGMQQGQLGMIELWPMPSEPGLIRVWGHMRLGKFIDDADLSTLDGDMLVLYVAGEMLMRSNKADAQLKLNEADRKRRMALAQTGADRVRMVKFGGDTRPPGRSQGITYVTKRPGT